MEKEFTSKEAAERLNVARRTFNEWCKTGVLIATLKQTAFGENYWTVSESVLKNFSPPRRGRKPKDFIETECQTV